MPLEVEWPGKVGAASLISAICRSLDKSVHRVETFAAMEQLASVLRSASRDGPSSHSWLNFKAITTLPVWKASSSAERSAQTVSQVVARCGGIGCSLEIN